MAKTRESKISETSQEIIHLLKRKRNKLTMSEIVALGYSKSTVRYYNRKLNRPEAYERMLAKSRKNSTKKTK